MILITGPTAAGKSALIKSLLQFDIEVINGDSQQVYLYTDIATAKPSEAEKSLCPHHLFDILEPNRQFTVGDFVKGVSALIPEIIGRGHLPVVIGGTGFYFKNLLFGLPETPPADELVRARLLVELESQPLAGFYSELQRLDPSYAEKIASNDKVRILRALEVFRLTGRPLSSFHQNSKADPRFCFLLLGLNRDREDLYQRIEKRVEQMFHSGLIEEIRGLLGRGYNFADPGLKGIGYREFTSYLSGCLSLDGLKELIKLNSRHYAKRQITFFKALEGIKWFHPDDNEGILGEIRDFLKKFPVS